MNLVPLAELPDSGWIIVGCIVIGIIGFVGVAAVLKFLQDFRENLSKEMKMQQAAAQEAMQVMVQQPLVVTAEKQVITRDEFEKQQAETKAELARHAASRKGIYERMENQGREIGELRAQSDQHGRMLTDLKGQIEKTADRIDQIPTRTINLLKETKDLI